MKGVEILKGKRMMRADIIVGAVLLGSILPVQAIEVNRAFFYDEKDPKEYPAPLTTLTTSQPQPTKAVAMRATARSIPLAKTQAPAPITKLTFYNEIVEPGNPMAPQLLIRVKRPTDTGFTGAPLVIAGGASRELTSGVEFRPESNLQFSVRHGNVAETPLVTVTDIRMLVAAYGTSIKLVKQVVGGVSNVWEYIFAAR